jgi:hypothetical protein
MLTTEAAVVRTESLYRVGCLKKSFTAYRWEVCRITNGGHIEPYLSEVNLGVFCYIVTVQNVVYVLCINFYKLSKL